MLLKKYTVGCFRPASAWRSGYRPSAGRNASPEPGACKGCRSCWRTPGDAVNLAIKNEKREAAYETILFHKLLPFLIPGVKSIL